MNSVSQSKLQELLRDFYNLTGIKVSIHDSEGNELCYYPAMLSPFCALLRKDAEMDAKCRECDRRAVAECKKQHRRVTYTCHAGLTECFAPVLYLDKIIGHIVVGQIKPSENADFGKVKSHFPTRLQETLQKEYDALPVIDSEKIKSAIHVIDACTGYEYLRTLVNENGRTLENRLSHYIAEDLSSNLSVDTLCRAFHLSRNEIYDIFRRRFDSTVADFVKERRMQTACKLCETGMPINKIAEKIGIPDYNYFSKQFKRRFGMSPTAYKKSLSRS